MITPIQRSSERVCVLGLGYIGLPTATILATHGFRVLGIDTNPNVVHVLNAGDVHIEEPGLRTMAQAAIKSGNLIASTEPDEASTFIIAVPTPLRDQRADLEFVKAASEAIVPHLKPNNLVVLESTVPPRTTQDVVAPILEAAGLKAGSDFHLAHCPERVLPGKILHEMVANDRIIGGITPQCAERASEIYKSFVDGHIFITDATSAEMVKVIENSYRDVNIALANELSRICADLGIDVWDVVDLANKHPRVNLHQPGPGVGGHCLPIDPWFVVEKSPDLAKLIRLSRQINDEQPEFVCKLIDQVTAEVDKPRVAIFGVTYKGNVDDTRESPAGEIIHLLQQRGIDVRAHDPHAREYTVELLSAEEAVRDADCVVVTVEHAEFRKLNATSLASVMRTPCVIDTKRCLDRATWEQSGFKYFLLGSGKDASFKP